MIRYRGLNLTEPQRLDYKNKDLLIIPKLGTKSLYVVPSDYSENNYDIEMILTTDLYTHVIITKNVDPAPSSSHNPQIEYAIADLEKDAQNENILYLPFPVPEGYQRYRIYLATYDENEQLYQNYNNIPSEICLMKEYYIPNLVKQTDHFTYFDNVDFECVFLERLEREGEA